MLGQLGRRGYATITEYVPALSAHAIPPSISSHDIPDELWELVNDTAAHPALLVPPPHRAALRKAKDPLGLFGSQHVRADREKEQLRRFNFKINAKPAPSLEKLPYAYTPDFVPRDANQPHHFPLFTRHDWRLRAVSQSKWQQELFAGKVLYRSPQAAEETGLTDVGWQAYESYVKHFRRLLQLERQASLDAALERVSKGRRLVGDVEVPDALVGVTVHSIQPFSRKSSTDLNQVVVTFQLPTQMESVLPGYRNGTIVFIRSFSDIARMSESPTQLDPIPYKNGTITKVSGRYIDVLCEADVINDKKDGYRLDYAWDDTSFIRMENALTLYLPRDPITQKYRTTPSQPHDNHREALLLGTELRQVLLASFLPPSSRPSPLPDLDSSSRFSSNQLANSWIKRYSRENPIQLPGDPKLGLNSAQTRAVATMLGERMSLIQGPPGTGKSSTIIAALRLLKQHFQFPDPILVCAPTHVAVDRLGSACIEAGLHPLRIGDTLRIKPELAPYTLQSMKESHPLMPQLYRYKRLRDRIKDTLADLQLKKTAAINSIGFPANDVQTTGLTRREALLAKAQEKRRVTEILRQIEMVRDSHDTQIHEQATKLRKLERKIDRTDRQILCEVFEGSDVCLTTCMGVMTWATMMSDFPIVFLDEAAQCSEPASLVPLMKGSAHVSLIGDHKQLPSVLISREAQTAGLNRSLFERLMDEKVAKSVLLDTQYRMKPSISSWPNSEFYSSALRDSSLLSHASSISSDFLGDSAVTFINHVGEEMKRGQSLYNDKEAQIVCHVVLDILRKNPHITTEDIGVISAYAAQVVHVKDSLTRVFESAELRQSVATQDGRWDHRAIEVSTVDGFQGREKEVIIFTTTRSNAASTIGFLKDQRRLNVALTRAKEALFVIGSLTTLTSKPGVWKSYLSWLASNGLIRHW